MYLNSWVWIWWTVCSWDCHWRIHIWTSSPPVVLFLVEIGLGSTIPEVLPYQLKRFSASHGFSRPFAIGNPWQLLRQWRQNCWTTWRPGLKFIVWRHFIQAKMHLYTVWRHSINYDITQVRLSPHLAPELIGKLFLLSLEQRVYTYTL